MHFTSISPLPQQRNNTAPAPALTEADLPVINWNHIATLTDDTGIIQHALHAMPNRKEGYCIDDNSRALLLAVLACKQEKTEPAYRLLPVYLSFVHYMQTEDGNFKNFMSYTKVCTEEIGSEDAFGRTMLALGYLVNEGPHKQFIKTGNEIFVKAFKHVHQLVSLRGIANSIIGICQYIKFNYPDDLKAETVATLADKLVKEYQHNKKGDWHWFDNLLTYDNAILPLALFNAFEITANSLYFDIALEAMQFLESVVLPGHTFRPVGNQGWYSAGTANVPHFDQQGIDAMAMILLYQQVFRITRDRQYFLKMNQVHLWFLGHNDSHLPLYDSSTGGCFDGLQADGVNDNQGAESTIAYWISHMVLLAAIKDNQE